MQRQHVDPRRNEIDLGKPPSVRVMPFRLEVDERELDDLRRRLERARRRRGRGEDADPGWERGTSGIYLTKLLDHWRTSYDWRRHEARLNRMPQYTTTVDGELLHFVHVRGRGARPLPLLLLHGWPDSFDRFHRVLPLLGELEIVVPSLPGFPFTGPLRRPSAEQPTRRAADLIWRLMVETLGHTQFVVAGGDGGSVIAQILAIDHPESVIGIHVTDLGWHATNVEPESLDRAERKYVDAIRKRFMADGAYAMVQSTRPRSLAVELNDSPIGLASWLVDRFHAWTDGDLDERVSKDVVLTNIMLHWISQTIGASIFNYYADARSPSLSAKDHVDRPVAVALFPKDIGGVPPRSFAERTLNVVRWTEMPRGGHFAPLEEPQLYANDILAFVHTLAPASREENPS